MPTEQKIDRVAELKDQLERSTITFSADYTRTTVNQMTELRRAMRAGGIEFTVVKNTLMYLAADQSGRPQVKEIVQGPSAVAFGYDDPARGSQDDLGLRQGQRQHLQHTRGSDGRRGRSGTRRSGAVGHPSPKAPDAGHVAGPDASADVAPGGCAERSGTESGQCAASQNAPNGRGVAKAQTQIRRNEE